MIQSLKKWLLGWLHGGPHFVIGHADRPYLRRWYILPRNRFVNVYLHQFLRDDDDRALHDHPWPYLSVILRGGYYEITGAGSAWYGPGTILTRHATHRHRVELHQGKPCWTLFITGPRVREWGFYCKHGWVHWREFTSSANGVETTKGCDQ